MPVIVQSYHGQRFAGETPRREAGPRTADEAGRFRNINPADAAEEIFAPSHGEEDSYRFARMEADGTVPNQGEVWDREHNSMRVRRRKFMMITASRAVVRSPEEITGMCTECNGPDALAVRCAVCGAILCQIHARVLEHPTGPAVYCRQHLEEALDNWDTWEAYDANRGVPTARKMFDGRPYAIARYFQPGGSRNA